ncbi:hypothetical protein FHX48_001132 [Microbacterium halimionae]|uniref:Uncharacterized protein n=1 Tax=Microbacterium halimionae TaxID=1526413 RepID=A0A7W3PLP2_9MICO|nr:hypothetical protein [Microbacterium halimionae]MBA8816059.1 hypothetical protein [Microbacterium halimionae]NII96261.1 hypothetical protein [Microbacterium halimionae]
MPFASPDDIDARLLRPYTRIRHVEPPEAPWSSVLSRTEDGSEVLLVDTEKFSPGWAWSAEPTGHVLGALEVIRTHSGHIVALPLCTEHLMSFLQRRRQSATPLSAGESVTILVSVLRGTLESFALGGDDAAGAWWLTNEGRPVLVPGGNQRLLEVAVEVVTETAMATDDEQLNLAVDEFSRALYTRASLEAHATEIETVLFSRAAPQPIATAGIRASASLLAPKHDRTTEKAQEDLQRASPSWATTLMPHIDSGVRELYEIVLGQLKSVRRKTPRTGTPRRLRYSWLWAAGVAAALVAAGLAWPAESEMGPEQHESKTSTTPTPTAGMADSVLPVADDDPVSAASMLLAARNICRAKKDAGCLEAVMADSSISIPEGAVDLPRDEMELALIDDYGGAASVGIRARGEQANSQVAVVVQTEKTWVLREVFTVAQHP